MMNKPLQAITRTVVLMGMMMMIAPAVAQPDQPCQASPAPFCLGGNPPCGSGCPSLTGICSDDGSGPKCQNNRGAEEPCQPPINQCANSFCADSMAGGSCMCKDNTTCVESPQCDNCDTASGDFVCVHGECHKENESCGPCNTGCTQCVSDKCYKCGQAEYVMGGEFVTATDDDETQAPAPAGGGGGTLSESTTTFTSTHSPQSTAAANHHGLLKVISCAVGVAASLLAS